MTKTTNMSTEECLRLFQFHDDFFSHKEFSFFSSACRLRILTSSLCK